MNYEELIKNNESINEELVEWINDRTIDEVDNYDSFDELISHTLILVISFSDKMPNSIPSISSLCLCNI